MGASTSTAVTGRAGRVLASPRARRAIAKFGLNARSLRGSGPGGRIVEADALAAATTNRAGSAPTGVPVASLGGGVSIMRRSIAQRTAESFVTIPHFYLRAEVDITDLVALRAQWLEEIESRHGVRITITDFLLRAQALALREFPAANAVWQHNNLARYANADVGVVVGLPDGLLIPVLRRADLLTLVELARERTRLVDLCRSGKVSSEQMQGGASSLSNLGPTRADEFAAVIAPHQSSMLAVGRAAPRPYVVNGAPAVRTTMRLCLSMDHRVLDGAPAAEFLGLIVQRLEQPRSLLT